MGKEGVCIGGKWSVLEAGDLYWMGVCTRGVCIEREGRGSVLEWGGLC